MTDPRSTARRSTRPHRWSFPVARVHGIDVRVHVSFLVLVALFAAAAPEPGIEGALLSVAWLLAVFVCVVLHELGHSLLAITRGAEVDEILLFPLGGVSRLRHLPESPGDELAIAIVGPLTSFAIAALAAIGCLVAGRDLLPIDLVAGPWLARLAWLNLILGAFNLLPAFPLDGGRVLRALLERRHDVVEATRIATRVGHVLAGTLIVVGFFADVWLVLIGLFVWFGGSAEAAATVAHARLKGHRVREVMEPVVAVDATEPVVDIDDPLDEEVLDAIASAPDHEVAVGHDGRVVGTVDLDHVVRLLRAESEQHDG